MAFPRRIRSIRLVVIARALSLTYAALLLIGCGQGETAAPPSEGAQVSAAQARNLYVRKCSLCHGDDGDLGASKSPMLSTSTLSLEERVALITYGKGTMPAQKGSLDRAEIEAVARYIEQFRN